MGLVEGLRGSLVAALAILLVLVSIETLGVRHPLNLSVMTFLVAVAVYVYVNFRKALGEPWFNRLAPPIIAASGLGVSLLWAGFDMGAVVIAAAYFGEPILGYFVYKRLREVDKTWAIVFLSSAAAYAYTLPLVLYNLWALPAAADGVKTAALVYFLWRLGR
ncbi:MAG: hypothetical protein QXR68_00425 [Pyrobaculum sp.]